jgi:hypothetical protein
MFGERRSVTKAPNNPRGFWLFGIDGLAGSSHDSHLAVRRYYETLSPATNFLLLEYLPNPPDEAPAIRRTESNEQDAAMRSGSELSKVGKIQILRNQESRISLRRFPNLAVAGPLRFSSATV